MRTSTICTQCAIEVPGSSARVEVELNDQLLFECMCERGHQILQTLETTRFSLLFDFGIAAFQDGYFREAVSSFAASLERLHEFFIRVICKKNGIAAEDVKLAWKEIGSQSERQLGAFCMLYLQEVKQPAPLVEKKNVEFRNNVIHKGYLPSKQETLGYGRAVHNIMIKILAYVSNELQQFSDEVWVEERAARAGDRPGLSITSHGNANFISRTADELRSGKTFDEKLEVFSRGGRERRWIFT
ncbi:MAG: hypothetical protein PGN26_15500 [Xylophilus ampelinus]